ncbi:TcaA NTF2-like domain-containing protein [Ectobacillus funiculus]|uniref:TcaA NTF2-like domain-containing protein n=1 Tax=Ectobacillus funiculus TaxID=137993 RepID=UPI00101DF114|nr:hypothetical protein [Ectobacillus funiculus]
MRIDDYKLEREIFANKHGLSVYEVTSLADGQRYILRLLDASSQRNGFQPDNWYNIYERYQLTITNFKHLPRVFSINMIDEFRLYTILEGEQGNTLERKGTIGRDGILQLIDAVYHLHQKKMVHGSVCAENIWLTNKGRVILYGAGESKAIYGSGQADMISDIRQLINVINQYASLHPEIMRNLKTENPKTIEEVEAIIWKEEQSRAIKNEQVKGGLVEKGELSLSEEISSLASKGESEHVWQSEEVRMPLHKTGSPQAAGKRTKPEELSGLASERNEEVRIAPNKTGPFHDTRKQIKPEGISGLASKRKDEQSWQPEEIRSPLNKTSSPHEAKTRTKQRVKRKNPWSWIFVAGIAGALALLSDHGWSPNSIFPRVKTSEELPVAVESLPSFEEQEQPVTIPNEQTEENDDEEQTDIQEEEAEEKSAPVVYTKKDVEAFMQEYATLRMKALNEHNFFIVEHLLDTDGPVYQELFDDQNQVESNGIKEKMLNFDISAILQIDSSTYQVSTSEKYDFIDSNSQKETKVFNGVYIVKVLADDRLAINKRSYKQETDSVQDSMGESESASEEAITKEAISAFMAEYMKTWGEALGQRDFSYVEELLDPNAAVYQNVSNHIQALRSNDTSEELLTYGIGDFTKLDETSYKVMVSEKYRLTDSDGKKEVKTINNEYVLIQSDGQLLIHEQLKTGPVDEESADQ